MIKAKFIVITGNIMQNKFAKAADIFDDGKFLVSTVNLEASFKEGEIVDFERCGKLIDVMKRGFETEKFVALIHLDSIIDENKILFNKTILPYINKSVREISDGQCHTMFHKVLSRLGIDFELTEHMYIK